MKRNKNKNRSSKDKNFVSDETKKKVAPLYRVLDVSAVPPEAVFNHTFFHLQQLRHTERGTTMAYIRCSQAQGAFLRKAVTENLSIAAGFQAAPEPRFADLLFGIPVAYADARILV